jgi:hypothetical protein
MKVKITLSSIFNSIKKDYIFENYDEKYFPPKPKGELSFAQMFEYWSKLFKEIGIDYSPNYFDMNKNIGIIFEIVEILNY